ncbi:hypothetical protein [Vagococcus salmoninarum]|uniref:hypothetical protein n=1 Tax=Vagococcus salmoninarum TaxID=2739 RepID=UPI003F9C4732
MTETKEQSIKVYSTIYDDITGEIVATTEPKPFKHKRQIEPSEKSATILKRTDDRKFTSVRVNKFNNLIQELTAVQLGYMLLLSSYQRYDSGVLYKSEDAKLPLDVEDVAKVIGKTAETAQGVIKKLVDKTAITIITVEYGKKSYKGLKVNDQFFYRGKASTTEARGSIKQYIEEIRQVYAENGAAATGWLGKLIPHIDKQTNFLCHNPDREQQYEEFNAMSRTDLEKLTGTIKRDVAKRINGMKIHGYNVFAEVVTSGRHRKIKVNPLIYCRMSGDVRAAVLKDFTLAGKF